MHAPDIVLAFWTLSYISAAFGGISVDTVQISCQPSSTNICISPLFPPNVSGLSSLKSHFQIWGGNWNCGAALRAARPGAWEDSLIRPRAATSEDSGKWGAFFPQAGCGRAWPLFSLSCGASKKMCKLWLPARGAISLFKRKCKVFSR